MSSSPAQIQTNGREVLFFDLAEIDETRNVRISVCAARKHPFNPILAPSDKNAWDSGWVAPWAMRGFVYDEKDGLFKGWYNGAMLGGGPSYTGFITSRDGVVWERPDLGLFESGGNKHNNIVHSLGWGCVELDRGEADPASRFKLLAFDNIAFSPDGVHWGPFQKAPMDIAQPVADPVAFVRDDQDPDPQRRYKYVFQYYSQANKAGPEKVRFKGIAFSADAIHWTGSRDNPILSPNEGFENENHFLAYVPYKGHWLLLYECAWYHPDGTGVFGRYVGDIRLAHSRDGERFARLNPHEVVIAKGAPGEWDGQFLVITDKIVVKDDTIFLYYCGLGTEWTSWPPQNQAPGTRLIDPKTGKGSTGKYSMRRMGLATLRLDGFTCMRVPDGVSRGSFITKPISLPDAPHLQLTVNVGDTRPGWIWLEVEVLDADTRSPLSGYSRKECGQIIEDAVRVPVRWAGKGLGNTRRNLVRLQFNVVGATKLYSFRMA
jgi:hypothetical protein